MRLGRKTRSESRTCCFMSRERSSIREGNRVYFFIYTKVLYQMHILCYFEWEVKVNDKFGRTCNEAGAAHF